MKPIHIILIVLVISVLSLSGGLYLSVKESGRQTQEIKGLKETVATQIATVNKIKENVLDMKKDQTIISEKQTKLDTELRLTNSRLDKSLDKENVVEKHPTMIENALNKNYTQFAKDFSCLTGAKEQCTK